MPPLTALTFVLSIAVSGWYDALLHAGFAALAVLVLVESIALTVPFMPFTRPYEPGHAKLKTRWPLYLIGVYLFGYVLVRIEKACWSDSSSFAILLLCLAATITALDIAGEVQASRRSTEPLPAPFRRRGSPDWSLSGRVQPRLWGWAPRLS